MDLWIKEKGKIMHCPNCQSTDLKVIDSRPVENAIRRRRECLNCHTRFTTFERIEDMPLRVIKRDGRREEFSHSKLLRGLVRSSEKRPIPTDVLEKLVEKIEQEFKQEGHREIKSVDIGEKVMENLPAIDEVAYIRYASVYRAFEDPSVFLKEIEALKNRQHKKDDPKDNQ